VEVTPGTILVDKYHVDQLLGIGGMGRVVKATHLYLRQPVAIKILLPEMIESSATVARFLREAQATVKLRSEHIARVIDVGTLPDGTPFMVMEYLQGNDLNQILRHHGPQAPNVVVDLILQACEGIAEAHAGGIIHRDIKPSNFFITLKPDGSMLLKILDFGISKAPVGYDDLTGTQTIIGTPSYMAPEQMKTAKAADPRSDIWSLGVVMYQLLAGRPPFEAENYAALVLKVGMEPPAPLVVQLPVGLGEVILRCLEKDPKNRHQSVAELARLLAPFATDPLTGQHSAERTHRILNSRGQAPTVPLTTYDRLATPVPLSPAQLTPRTWPPSQQGSSLSNGAGQLTYKTRAGRGMLIAGIAGLVVIAGAGGWIAARSLKDDSPSARRDEPYVQAPASPPTTPATPAKAPEAPPTPVKNDSVDLKSIVGDSKGTDAKAAKTVDAKSGDAKTVDAKTTDAKAGDAKTADAKAGNAKTADAKAGDAKTADAKSVKTADAKTADAKTADAKTVDAKTADAKTTDAKAKAIAETKPVAKPVVKPKPKPKPPAGGDDLFDSRH
jgi:eukaryotic-like serine/threonine-protein kinase